MSWIQIHSSYHCLIDGDMVATFPDANPTYPAKTL